MTKLLYFINQGGVEEIYSDESQQNHIIGTLGKGEFFGMRTLTGLHPNKTSFYTQADTEVTILDSTAVKLILQSYPQFAQTIETVLKNRDEKLSRLKQLIEQAQ